MRFKERNLSRGSSGGLWRSSSKSAADLAEGIQEGGYVQQQTLSVDGTAFFQEQMLTRIFIAGEEKSVSG